MSATALVYAVLSGVLPSFIWLFFWLREDRLNPEPRSLLVACFFGGISAVIAAVFAEKYIANIYTDPSIRYTLWAAIEEVFKFVAVAVIALHNKAYNEPIDAMIYAIVVAIGFSALENTLFIFGPLSGGEIVKSIVTGNMRFIGATLLHVIASGAVGFALAFSYRKSRPLRTLYAAFGLILAVILHTTFNTLIIMGSGRETLSALLLVWSAAVVFFALFEVLKYYRYRRLEKNTC